ncbi:hypothetical protein Acr_10g0005550 [Actinidia rufa]|uniref:Uncharacterized protein n=1 Tax=Actinidia rufa TaxID=165716 RepID=A0A7J0F8X8_9ERIC|nr:hypothetical protein Acr_10g0005550 [Actinidia rufa]
MELNRTQQIVHNNHTLVQFRRDHGILNNVIVERPDPIEVVVMMRGHGDRIPIHTWLIHHAELRFLLSPMLKKLMALCDLTFMQVYINFVTTMLTIDTLMRRQGLPFFAFDLLNIYMGVRPKWEPGMNLFTDNWEFQRLCDYGLWDFPRTNGSIDEGFNIQYKLDRIPRPLSSLGKWKSKRQIPTVQAWFNYLEASLNLPFAEEEEEQEEEKKKKKKKRRVEKLFRVEKDHASFPTVEVESSCLAAWSKKENDKGKAKTLVFPIKSATRQTRDHPLTPPLRRFLPPSFGTLRCRNAAMGCCEASKGRCGDGMQLDSDAEHPKIGAKLSLREEALGRTSFHLKT